MRTERRSGLKKQVRIYVMRTERRSGLVCDVDPDLFLSPDLRSVCQTSPDLRKKSTATGQETTLSSEARSHPPFLSRCRRRQVSFARRTTRGARPAVRTVHGCRSPEAVASLANCRPCYHHEALRGRPLAIAQCKRSTIPLSLRIVCAWPTSPLSVQPRAIQNYPWLPWLG